ncbi:uncharacterized protein LOC110833165 [Zootermopsis nevadensis]|nr:uncharacterized protein LOC110833165 [Zootermopsis nevadensis]
MKLLVLVFTIATNVLESQTIIVLDNTKQLPLKNIPQEEPTVAESNHEDVKIQGFRSSVVHKPGTSDGQTGGLTVQDPPKGWPFSEINVNFNSHMSENEPKVHPEITTYGPDKSRIRQKHQPRLKHQNTNQNLIRQHDLHHVRDLIYSERQNLHQHHEQTYAPVTISNGFSQTSNSNELKQTPPYIITANGHQQSGLVPENSHQNSRKEPTEIIPKIIHPKTELQTGHNFGILTPPNIIGNNNVIKHDFSASGGNDNKLLINQQQQDHNPEIQIQSTTAHNMAPNNGDPNYVWRDISPGLEVSSNAPQAAGGLHRNSVAARKPETTSGHFDNSKVGGQSHIAYFQVPNFDHANALGHSTNFGYRDAVLYTPTQFHANQEQLLTIPQGHSAGVLEQENQYQNSRHQLQNSVSVNENTGDVFTGTNNSPGFTGHKQDISGGQHHQQHPEIQSTLQQTNYGFDVSSHKVPLTLNKGLQRISGPLVLGNGLHLGYATRNTGHHNIILPMQDIVNAGNNGIPLQAYYVPLVGLQSGQVENHQTQAGIVGSQHAEDVQRKHPQFVDSHMAKSFINTAPLIYVGMPMGNGYTGFRGLPLIQGNLLGIQGLHGVVGGSHHVGGMFPGGNYISLPDGGLAFNNQNHPEHKTYKPTQESTMQATGQHHNTFQTQSNQYVPMSTGNNIISFENTVPYQHQQANNQINQAVRPQINVHPNGFALKIQQQHPISQHNFNSGGYKKSPFGGNRIQQQPSNFPAHDFVLGEPKIVTRGHQAFSLPPISTANGQHSGFKLNLPPATPLKYPPLNIPQETPQSHLTVKRDENISKQPAATNIETQLRDKNAHGWHLASKPGKPTGLLSNSLFPINMPHVIGLRPPTPNTNPSFIK